MNFNTEAANWDTPRRIHRANIIANEIKKIIPINTKWKALEFGCGTGLISFNLCDQFSYMSLLDTSLGMIEKLHEKIKTLNVQNMTPIPF